MRAFGELAEHLMGFRDSPTPFLVQKITMEALIWLRDNPQKMNDIMEEIKDKDVTHT